MSFFLQLCYLPAFALVAAVGINHFAGNDKAPFIMLAVGLVSLVVGLLHLFTLRPLKAMIAFTPLAALIVLVAMSRLGLIDLMPILGFR